MTAIGEEATSHATEGEAEDNGIVVIPPIMDVAGATDPDSVGTSIFPLADLVALESEITADILVLPTTVEAEWGTYGWGGWNDGNYGYWGPGYDTYSYDYSSDNQSGMEPEIAPQYAQSTEGEQGQGGGKLPPLPTNKELASFTNQQLNSFIAWVARGYSRELGQFSTGDTWVKYFKLDNLRALAPQPPAGTIAAQPPETPTARSRSLDKEVLERMDSVLQKNEYQTVTNAWGFKALRAALKEVSRPADERTVTVLKGQAEMLNKSLERSLDRRWLAGDIWRSIPWSKSPMTKTLHRTKM